MAALLFFCLELLGLQVFKRGQELCVVMTALLDAAMKRLDQKRVALNYLSRPSLVVDALNGCVV